MKFLNKLNISTKILINVIIAILIIGSVSITEYNTLLHTEKIKNTNQILYNTQILLYKLQSLVIQSANLAFKAKNINDLAEFIATQEKFSNVENQTQQLINQLKNISVTNSQNPEINQFYYELKDTLYKYQKIIENINLEFDQISKFKSRLLKPHNIEENYIQYLQEEEDILSGSTVLSATSSNYVKLIVQQIIEKYEQNINNHLNAIQQNVNAINQSISIIQIHISKLIQDNNEHLNKTIRRTKFINIIVFLVGILIAMVITFITINSIVKPLIEIEKVIRKLSAGELPNYEPHLEENEIGVISASLAKLIDALKETSKFTEKLSKGDFDVEITPLSDKDEFRNYLLDLRDNLKRAKEEEEKRKIEDYQRRRVSEGLAKFAEILRGHHKDLKKLAEEIIINLVRYLNANQGVFFILNDKDPNNVYLELYAAYAWNRKKYLEKKIALGEGLIGAVAVEKFTIYMTDVPEDYIEIKSGTGEADPRAILIVPLKVEDNVLGVIELATFEEFKPYEIELVEKIGENIASTLQNIRINEKTEELLRRSQQQAEEMKRQEEIMRKTIGELKRSQEENLKKEQQLKKLLEDLEKANQRLKIKDLELQKEIEKLKEEYNKKLQVITNLSAAYKQILAKMKSPVIMFNKDGKILFANTAAEELWEYDKDKLLKLELSDLFEKSIIFKDKLVHKYLIENQDQLSQEQQNLFIKRADGSLRKVLLDLIKIDADPDNILYVLIITSLEEVEKKEKQAKELLEKCYAKELEYILKIEFLEDIIKQNNLILPDIDFTQDLIKWSEKFMMGIEVIDKQHQKWIEFINKLYRALKQGAADDILNEIFNELIEYTKYHFGFEEKYMAEFGFEDIENHKKEHENFVNELYAMFNEYLEEKPDVPFQLITYLKRWVERHVLVTDRKYSKLFKEKGLK